MSELTNIHARAARDLTTPTNLPADPNALDQVKLVAGNFPPGYAGNEALTLGMVKEITAHGREAELEDVLQKITEEEIRAKEAERLLNQNKVEKTYVDSELEAQTIKVNSYLSNQSQTVNTHLSNQTQDVNTALSQLSTQASKFYPTLAAANADIANVEVNQPVQVGEAANGGLWYKATAGATSLTKSPYDPVKTANKYTDSNMVEVKTVTKNMFQAPDQDVVAVLTDAKNKVLLGYDTQKDKPVVAGLEKEIKDVAFENLKNLRMSNDRSKIAVLIDKNNRILIGYDAEKDEPILAGLNTSQIETNKKYEAAFEQKLLTNAVNHFLFYGQSLSIGATATTILSTSQPYSNITFNTGPRMDSTATSTIPLVEQFNNPASDGGANRGETCCSAAANYVSRSIAIDDGGDPASHVIFASTAGIGGTIINNLKKGSSRYNFMLSQVTKAKQLVGSDYKVQLVTWIQGESDIDQGTTYENYKAMLEQLQIDMSTDIKAITGQSDDIKLITYQCSYKAQVSSAIALAQLHLSQETTNIFFACPTYRMPYHTDKTHLTNVGYKLMGAYFGRAYKQLVIDNVKPDFLKPKTAVVYGRKIEVNFEVPQLPLQIDTTALAPTQDHGFKVLDSAQNQVIIESIDIDQNKVILNCSAEITGNVTVRYALDYLGTGLNILNGGSGNLRDSSNEFVEILNQKYQLFNACPAFEITAFLDKGI